ncbi:MULTISPECIES: TetR/AcrR family transcriptional regulator [Anaerolinea]|uniref:TetR/AcrR family transcriptional regulator n=1 Tax=Anaerolinea TaxID=233189 RepID=UPI002621A45D|nr:TetR/AcrR family transcriptional regulator [Anaerolinea thermophila]
MQQRSEETRQKILQAAEVLFAQKGYDATGVADLCAASGVSKGAFYHHFPSKQSVFLALLEEWLKQLDEQLQQTLSSHTNIPEGLIVLARSTEAIFEGSNTRARIFLEFWIQATRQPEIWQAAVAPYYRYLERFTQLIQDSESQGSLSLKEGVDPRTIARTILALALGMLLQAFFDPQGEDWSKVTGKSIEWLFDALQKGGGQ